MKADIYINGIYERIAPPALLRALEEVYPDGRIRHFFKMHLPLYDARARKVLEVLAHHGWTPRTSTTPEGIREGIFTLHVHRHYDSGELDTFSYLRFKPSEYLCNCDVKGRQIDNHSGPYRDQTINTGRIQLEPEFLRKELDFASAEISGLWPVVPNRVKHLLDSANLRHILFMPTSLVKWNRRPLSMTKLDWKSYGDPWWEVGSDLRLPPQLPASVSPNQPIAVDAIVGGKDLPDSLYAPCEYRYRASDLEAFEPFDLAHTHEGWAANLPQLHDRPLIASQRFRQICLQHGFKADWAPVRVE